ncbi:MAG: TIGR03564 family F420-dependent LLM class oxidoreductase [Acidimicrobiales bacterium]
MLGPTKGSPDANRIDGRSRTSPPRAQGRATDRRCRGRRGSGLRLGLIPQVPDDFDAMTAAAVTGARTERIEIGTAVVALQSRHPVALAQQALSTQAVCEGRFTLGIGPSHHWIVADMMGLPYERPAAVVRSYLDVLDAAFAGPGPVDVENEHFRIHNPLDITDITRNPVLVAALGPVMLRLAGERTDGTILWMADERAIGEHIAPRLTAAAEGRAAGPAHRGGRARVRVPRFRGRHGPRRADRILAEAEISPNYQALLDRGDARNVSDILAAGSEATVLARLRSFADVRDRPLGPGAAHRRRPRRAARLEPPDPRVLASITPRSEGPQLVLHHLAGGVERDVVDHVHLAGHLVVGHPVATPRGELADVELGPRGEHHEGAADLTHPFVGHADHGRSGYRVVGQQRVLDLGRVRVEAAHDEHVLQPADDAEVAALVERPQVAGVEPTIGVDRLGVAAGSSR